MKRSNTKRRQQILATLVVALTAGAGGAEAVEQTVEIPMRDRLRLEATLVRPGETDDLATILVRTPYGREQHLEEARFWARHGYAVVVQDARGKFGSPGDYIPFLNEQADGSDTLDWIVRQSWSNGRVGMWGSSYLAFCQLLLASTQHPALVSILPISGWLHDGGMIENGGAHHIMLSIPWILHEESPTKRPIVDVDLDELFEFLPLIDVFASIGLESRIWNEDFDFSPLRAYCADAIRIPALHITGWNDFAHDAALDVYRQALRGPAAPLQRLLVGPWFHDQLYTTYTEAGDEDFGPASAMGREKLQQLSLAWFDATVGKGEAQLADWPRVKLFLMGADEWREVDRWPPLAAEPLELFLSSAEGANSSSGDGSLALAAPAELSSDSYRFDPLDPVPTYGGANLHFLLHLRGVKDQREIEKRRDVLVYTTAPLEEAVEIVGRPQVVLYASTEGVDTDFTAKLVEVRAGYARIVEEGILRASYRDGSAERRLLEERIRRLLESLENRHRSRIRVKTGDKIKLIPVSDVAFLLASDKYVEVHTKDVSYLISESLSQLESALPPDGFVRVHRSAIVNVDFIDEITKTFAGACAIRIKGSEGSLVPVSRRYKSRLELA